MPTMFFFWCKNAYNVKVKLFVTSITCWLCGTAESAKQPVKKARDTTGTEMSKTGIFSYSNMT